MAARIHRHAELQRRTAIRAINRQRKARREATGEVYGPYHKSMASLPCAVLKIGECYGDVAGHHLKSVGAGGKDEANVVPLCWWHHREVHTTGPDAFEWRHGISLEAEAAYRWRQRDEELLP